jgi:hypothetical protein
MLVAGLGATALTPRAVLGDTPSNGMRQIGQLDFDRCAYNQRHLFAVDEGLHLLLETRVVGGGMQCTPAQKVGAYLRAISTSSLEVVADVRLGITPYVNSSDIQTVVVDSSAHRLFLTYLAPTGESLAAFNLEPLLHKPTELAAQLNVLLPAAPPAATAISTTDPAGGVPPAAVGASGLPYLGPVSMQYDAGSGSLLVVEAESSSGSLGVEPSTSAHGPLSAQTYIFQLDGKSGALQWAQQLAACFAPLPLPAPSGLQPQVPDPVMRIPGGRTDVVAVGCAYRRGPTVLTTKTNSSLDALIGGGSLTYLIPLNERGVPVGYGPTSQGDSSYYIGRPGAIFGVADPLSGRIFYATSPPPSSGGPNSSGPAAVTFDAVHRAYVGAPSVGPGAAAGGGYVLAAGGGRLYSFGPGGVVLVDAGATPLGQGVVLPTYSCNTATVVTDASLRRLFVQPYAECSKPPGGGAAPLASLLVYQDEYPGFPPAIAIDPDTYTTQVVEQPDKTFAQYGGHAAATGTRLRLVGGVTGLIRGATFGGSDVVLGSTQTPVSGDSGTRDLNLAVVTGSGLDNYQVSARALPAGTDPTTEKSAAWPFAEAACSDPGRPRNGHDYGADTATRVECNRSARLADASSSAGPVGFTFNFAGGAGSGAAIPSLPATLGQSAATTTVRVDPDKGLVSQSHAIVKHADIGAVSLASIEAKVECQAHGHTSTAICTYRRVLSGVRVNGALVGTGSCVTDTTPANAVDTCRETLAALNAVQPGQLVFTMPSPDLRPGYLRGTPGGYQAVAQRELYQHLQDGTLNYDSSLEVPALQVLYVNDSFSAPSRLDLQLANVQAEAHYGVQAVAPMGISADGVAPVLDSAGILPSNSGQGLSANAVPEPAPATGQGGGPGGLLGAAERALERVLAGLTFFARSPQTGLLVASLLALLGAPLGVAWRRRRLMSAFDGEP